MARRSHTDSGGARPAIHRGRAHRAVATALAVAGLTLASCLPSEPPPPRDGVYPWEGVAQVAVPAGVVNAAGGSLRLARTDLSVDTRLGTHGVGAVYHSVAGRWAWSFEARYDGARFVDPGGTVHDVSAVSDGSVIPGTDWIRVDATRVRTRGGRVLVFDGVGALSALHRADAPWPRLRWVRALVGEVVRVVAVEQCTSDGACQPVLDLEWDAGGRLAAVEDRAGRRAELSWDAAGRLVGARNAFDLAEGLPGMRYAYQGGRVVAVTTSDGERTEVVWADGRVAEVRAVAPGTPTHRFTYERLGPQRHRTVHRDPTGVTVRIEWDGSRRVLRREVPAAGVAERWVWSGLRWTEHERVDATLETRTWQDGWLVSHGLPDGNVVTYTWNETGVNPADPRSGAALEVRDVLGVRLAVEYDVAGLPVAVSNGAGERTRFSWDGLGALASWTSPAGTTVRFEGYGEHGHPTRIVRSDGEVLDEREYDAVGNLLRGSDLADPTSTESPGVLERGFDAGRRVAWVLLVDEETGPPPDEHELRIERRSDGRPRAIRRPYGGDTELDYDALGRLVARRQRVDGTWRATTYEYDDAGRLTAVTRPNGMRREQSWDTAGRLETVRHLRHGVEESVLTRAWDGTRLVGLHDSVRDAWESLTYDAAGRVERVVHARGEATELVYDARSRPEELVWRLPDGTVLRRLGLGYDDADRETEVRDGDDPVLERTWQDGRLVRTGYGNGLEREYFYGDGESLEASFTRDAEGGFVASTEIRRTKGGILFFLQKTTRTADPLGLVADPPEDSAPGEVRTVENHVLMGGVDPDRPAGLRLEYTSDRPGLGWGVHDALGSRRETGDYWGSDTPLQRRYLYNAERNRVRSIESLRRDGTDWWWETFRTYEWDEAGFVTALDGVPVTWNAQGRIASVGDQATFVWDASGRPVSRTVAGETTEYWFGGAMEAPAGAVPEAIDLGEVRLDLVAGDHRYRHLDVNGHVKFVTDRDGAVVAHHLYGASGRRRTFGPSDDHRGFVGGSHVLGFVVVGGRVLDPEAGRFLSPDPVPQLLDAYNYAWSNPVHYRDATGLHPSPDVPGAKALPVVRFFANFFLLTGTVFGQPANPEPISKTLGITAFLLGLALDVVARDIERRMLNHPTAGGNDSPPTRDLRVPEITAPDVIFRCNDDGCFRYRGAGSGIPPGATTPGGGGGGVASASCGGAPPGPFGPCGLGAELAVILPFLLRWRRRRLGTKVH